MLQESGMKRKKNDKSIRHLSLKVPQDYNLMSIIYSCSHTKMKSRLGNKIFILGNYYQWLGPEKGLFRFLASYIRMFIVARKLLKNYSE